MSDAVRVVESEVRELIRRSGLDPARHPVEVGRLVQDVISDYDERSLHGGMPAILDRQEAAKQVMDVVAGFGPLQRYFDDPTVEEIWINEPSKVFVARRGIAELTTTILTPDVLCSRQGRTDEATMKSGRYSGLGRELKCGMFVTVDRMTPPRTLRVSDLVLQ